MDLILFLYKFLFCLNFWYFIAASIEVKVVKFNAFIVAFIYEYFRLKVEQYLVHNSYNYLKAMLTRLINCQVNVRIILFFLFEDV